MYSSLMRNPIPFCPPLFPFVVSESRIPRYPKPLTLNSKQPSRQFPEAKLAGLPTCERDCSLREGHPDAHERHKCRRGPEVIIRSPDRHSCTPQASQSAVRA